MARVKDPEQREINRELFGFMTSASLLMDENIVMRFRKVEEALKTSIIIATHDRPDSLARLVASLAPELARARAR